MRNWRILAALVRLDPTVENHKVGNTTRLRIPACFAPMMSLTMSQHRGPPLFSMPIDLNRGLAIALRFKRKWRKFAAKRRVKMRQRERHILFWIQWFCCRFHRFGQGGHRVCVWVGNQNLHELPHYSRNDDELVCCSFVQSYLFEFGVYMYSRTSIKAHGGVLTFP